MMTMLQVSAILITLLIYAFGLLTAAFMAGDALAERSHRALGCAVTLAIGLVSACALGYLVYAASETFWPKN